MFLNVKNNVLKSGKHYLTSDYKTRNKNRKNHNGIDLVGGVSVDEIIALDDGIVKYVGYDNSGGGYWVSINSNGIEHRYFHLAKGSIKVKKNDKVVKGQVIASMGKSGNATNYCLHFAIYNKGYIDPLPYLISENLKESTSYNVFINELKEVFKLKNDANINQVLAKTITISTSKNWKHPVVLVIQKYLKSLGYDLGKYGLDGKFGKDMKKVIIEYQKNNKLIIKDGIITAKKYTWQKLLNL